MSTVDEKPPAPRPARLERLQRTDSDFHKVMSDFEQLMAAAAAGQLGNNPGGVLPEPAPVGTLRQLPSSGLGLRRAPSETSSQYRLDSALEAKYFSGASNFAAVGTPPISAGGQSMASRGSSSDSSMGGSAQRIRSLPPLSYTTSSLGVESTAAARLRQRVSPRPNSVPLHTPDTLVVLGDDDRPATTHELVSSSLQQQDGVESLLMPKMCAQREELKKEIDEIEELRRKRDDEREQRQRERDERRRRRTAENELGNVWQGASQTSSSSGPAAQTDAPVAPVAPVLSPAEEAARRLKIQQAVLSGLVDLEATERNKLINKYAEFVTSAVSSLEELAVLEQSEHRTRIRRILEQGAVMSARDEERRRTRVLEVVRDCVHDESDERAQIEALQSSRFLAASRDFVATLESPIFSLIVSERLERAEWVDSVEAEMFLFIRQSAVMDLEKLNRQSIERMSSRLFTLTIAEPVATLNRSVAVLRAEGEARRLMRLMWEDEHVALWEWFCEELVPRLERQLWHTIVNETNERLQIERDEREDAEVCFHGTKTIRPLVQRYAETLERSRRELKMNTQRSFAALFEEELSRRAVLQQGQREAHILLQEQHRREEERLLTLMKLEKKRSVEEAMAAARKLREEEEKYLKKQLKSLAASNSQKVPLTKK